MILFTVWRPEEPRGKGTTGRGAGVARAAT